jgi:hypothetical protein
MRDALEHLRRRPIDALPHLALLIYVVVVAWRIGDVARQVFRFSDVSMVPLVARGWQQGRGDALLVTQDSVVAHLYDSVFAPTGALHPAALLFGPLLSGLAAVVMTVTVRRLFGGRAALLTLALTLALPPVILWANLQQNNHLTTVLITAVLGWHAVLLASGRRSVLRALWVGLATGVCVISDPQALVSAVLPFAITVVVMAWRADVVRAGRIALGVTAAAGVAAFIALPLWMSAAGIHTVTTFSAQPSVGGVVDGIGLALRGLIWMTGGGWYGDDVTVATLPGLLLAILVMGLPFAVIKRLRRTGDEEPVPVPRGTHALFWALSAAGIVGAFLLAGASTQNYQAHYVIAVYYAAAALVPFVAEPQRRSQLHVLAVLAVSAVVFEAALGVALVPSDAYATTVADPADTAVVARLQAEGLSHGYAPYWDAYDLDWLSGEHLDIWPVTAGRDCGTSDGARLCAYGSNTVTGAYTGTAGPTFVVVRGTGSGCVHRQPDPALFGQPSRSWTVGNLTVYVYPADVAQHFSPAVAPFCTSD